MMNKIKARIRREFSIFKQLNKEVRLLLFCIVLFTIGGSFLGTFLNIYLWRSLNNLEAVAFFNLFFFVGLPLGFIINGYLFKKMTYISAFQLGVLAQGVFPLIIIVLQERVFNYLAVLGLINGFSAAFYWANLNLLIHDLTSDKMRGYYTGINEVTVSIVGIVSPPLVGFVISILGQRWLRLDPRNSYYLSFSIAAFFFLMASFIAGKITGIQEKLTFSFKRISFRNLSKHWTNIRIMSIASGFPNGVFTLSWSLLAFEFFGRELEVGWFNGFLNVIGVIAAYLAGRLATPKRRLITIAIGTFLYFFGTVFFGINFSIGSFYLLGMLTGFGDNFLWAVESPVLMKEIDRGYLPKNQRYFYWIDRELFINLGRALGLTIFIFLANYFAFGLVYRILFILVALSSLVLFITVKKLIEVD